MRKTVTNRESNIAFAIRLAVMSFGSLLMISAVLIVMLKLDLAFFQAQGMIRSAQLEEAVFFRVLWPEAMAVWLLLLSLLAITGFSLIFGHSQFGYTVRFSQALEVYSRDFKRPVLKDLGLFMPHLEYFFEVLDLKVNGQSQEKVDAVIQRAGVAWPRKPQLAWKDHIQFTICTGVLSVLFGASCLVFFGQANERIIQLSQQQIRFSNVQGPSFFTVQSNILLPVVFIVLGVNLIFAVRAAFRYANTFSTTDYALLRDMRTFMQTDPSKRFYLRYGDPGEELVPYMNQSLARIATRIENPPAPKS